MKMREFFISLFVGFLLMGLGGCGNEAMEDVFKLGIRPTPACERGWPYPVDYTL